MGSRETTSAQLRWTPISELRMYYQLVVHVIDKHNTKNHKDICVLAYNGEKKSHNWQVYVLGHKKCHDVQTALVK